MFTCGLFLSNFCFAICPAPWVMEDGPRPPIEDRAPSSGKTVRNQASVGRSADLRPGVGHSHLPGLGIEPFLVFQQPSLNRRGGREGKVFELGILATHEARAD